VDSDDNDDDDDMSVGEDEQRLVAHRRQDQDSDTRSADAKSMEKIVACVAQRQTDVSLSVRRGVLDALTAWMTDPPIE
jgi:hypothetical protein